MIRALTAAGAVLAGTLALAGTGAAQDLPATDPKITDGSAQQALDTARAAWKKAAIKSYQVRVALGCFCPRTYTMPRTIRVRRGAPVNPPPHLKDMATVPRMFKKIQGAIDGKVAAITVKYGTHGVPKSISIDRDRRIADEEEYYTVDRFKKR
jgi:hypothetical protein